MWDNAFFEVLKAAEHPLRKRLPNGTRQASRGIEGDADYHVLILKFLSFHVAVLEMLYDFT